MKLLKILKKNKLLFIILSVYILLLILKPDKAFSSGKNSLYYIIEMLQIMPVIFILTSLIEAWVPREVIMNGFGEKAGAKGALFSFLLGSFSAGPIYAAFPVCKTLLKKGAKISNIVIILSAWAVIKVPMLANEAKFLGPRFMGIRWVLTTISIFIMAYIIGLIIKKDSIPDLTKETTANKAELLIKKQYCIGCGICAKLSPENFTLSEGKAQVINKAALEEESINKAIQKCPAKAISFN